MTNKKLLYIGSTLIGLMVIVAVIAPWIALEEPTAMSLPDRYAGMSLSHPFGRDQNGSDVFTQVVYGARVSLLISFIVVGFSTTIGLTIGSISGFYGGRVDSVIMRFIDVIYAFPSFLLALALVAVLGPSLSNLIFAMCLTSWTGYARLVRGEVLHLKNRDYVISAQALGATPWRQISKHIWPNLFGALVVQATFGMAGTILAESSLSFLGLGAPPSTPTWGALLNSGRQVLFEAPHVSIFPGLAIVILVLGFNLFGDGLRDQLDPKKY